MRHKLVSLSTYMRFRQSVLWAVAVLSVWPYNLAAQSIIQPDPQAGNSAGVIVAVRGSVQIMRNNTRLEAKTGTTIITGDSISTGANGWAQIAMQDHTLFSLAEHSQLGIDQFRIDENPKNSRLFSQLVSGVVKFISGRIATRNSRAMEVKFGTVTAAIRGTSGVISRSQTGQAQLTLLSGRIDLTDTHNRTISQLVKSGWGVDISASGRPTAVHERPASQLSSLLAQTASNRPADAPASTSRLDSTASIATPASSGSDARPLSHLIASGEAGGLSPE